MPGSANPRLHSKSSDSMQVAIKMLDVNVDVSEETFKPFLAEARILETVSTQCEHGCRFYGVGSIEGQPCIVMKLYPRSLADELKAAPGVSVCFVMLHKGLVMQRRHYN